MTNTQRLIIEAESRRQWEAQEYARQGRMLLATSPTSLPSDERVEFIQGDSDGTCNWQDSISPNYWQGILSH